jgi:hypothetical protein
MPLASFVMVACAVAALLYFGWKHFSLDPAANTAEGVRTGVATEILVMHTNGGLLEVSRINATEQFDQAFVYTVLGAEVGRTVAHIRVPAVYRYHIELAPEWEVYRRGDLFKVITPPVRPSLPVAVDLAKMEKDVGGSWYLVPFNDQQDLDALEREITGTLATKAASPVYMNMQKEEARKAVTEFVMKWLIDQEAWREASQPRLEVVFGE